MSVRFDASGDGISRTSNFPTLTSYTACGWARRVDVTTWASISSINQTTSSSSNELNYTYNSNGTTLGIYSVGHGSHVAFSTMPANNVWYFWAIVNQGTGASDCIGYKAEAGGAMDTLTLTGSSYTVGHMSFGNNTWNNYLNGSLCALKLWNAALSASELANERWSFFPKRLSDLLFFNPGINHSDVVTDWTGTADYTVGGTLATEDNPPISWRLPKSRIVSLPGAGAPPATFPPNSLALSGVGK